MTELNQIYKCNVCGNMVEIVNASGGTLVCCNQQMQLLRENTTDASQEKHVPVIEKTKNGVKVKIGSVPHPMEEKHYIQWIEINMIEAGRIAKKYLKPGDSPETEFHSRGKVIEVRAYCNLHGLWKA